MARKRALKQFSKEELLAELGERLADEKFHDGMTMSEMELAAEEMARRDAAPPPVAAMLSRMKPEKPTGKACPRCGKRIPVKARDRERTVKSLAGPVTFKRNYHYCEKCEYGFYPVDRLLGLPEEGELTSERAPDEVPPLPREPPAHRQRRRRERPPARAPDPDEAGGPALGAAQRPADGSPPCRVPHGRRRALLRRDPPGALGDGHGRPQGPRPPAALQVRPATGPATRIAAGVRPQTDRPPVQVNRASGIDSLPWA
jgi:hypothetical protein